MGIVRTRPIVGGVIAAAVAAFWFVGGDLRAVFGCVVTTAFNTAERVTTVHRTVTKPLARKTLRRSGIAEYFYLNRKVEKVGNFEYFGRFGRFGQNDHTHG